MNLRLRPCTKVDLYENGTIAIVEATSPELGNRVQRVRVQLPGTSGGAVQLEQFLTPGFNSWTPRSLSALETDI